MTKHIKILVGTMTGTAELCAEEMCDSLEEAGYSAEMTLMDKLDAKVFGANNAYIICTSTYGHGDVPDNAKKLYESCLLYTSPSPRDRTRSRMPSSA